MSTEQTVVAHTPGVWRWTRMDGDRRNPLWVLQSPKNDVVLTIKDLEFGPTTNPEANRALISAAPDLLAALVALKDHIADGMTFTNDGAGWQPDDLPLAQLMTTAEEAIAKATGAQP